ncbi:MAG: precorrin-6Y C5,15-methyltransferase (decarboxylating) subunit CbiT [Veillonella parvula]|nr:precorrin-6Y C5,15-methyltransferase (decarboxylating) subunit CbiT [Veillonella parvula]
MRHFFGIPDEEFIRGDVPMTKCEIRKAVMNEARIEEDSIVLDVGAGTGSISIEAALAAPKGHVYAMNIKKFNVNNMTVIKSKAPEGMEELPELDAVIIGGSAGGMTGIMDEAQRLLKVGGRLVVTAVTMETGYTILKELKGRPFTYEGYQMSISRYRKAGPYHLLDPLSPIFIVSATRIAEGE